MARLCPTCRNTETTHAICDDCTMKVRHQLAWLTTNLPELQHYTINRAYGHATGNGGGGGHRADPPTPLREHLHDLLHMDTDGNLEDTLTAWSLCLNLPTTPELADMADQLNHSDRLQDNPATPVYARELNRLTRQLHGIVDQMNSDNVNLGTCPNPICNQTIYAPTTQRLVECPQCHCKWTQTMLLQHRAQQLDESNYEGKPADLIAICYQMGIDLNPSTLRTWIHRGKIPPVLDTDGNPTGKYRLSDVYKHATKTEEQ